MTDRRLTRWSCASAAHKLFEGEMFEDLGGEDAIEGIVIERKISHIADNIRTDRRIEVKRGDIVSPVSQDPGRVAGAGPTSRILPAGAQVDATESA